MLVKVVLLNGQTLRFVTDNLPTDPWAAIDGRARELLAERHPLLADEIDHVDHSEALA